MIRKDLKEFLKTIPENVKVVAATKYADIEDMKELYANGVKDFGENRADSFLEKYDKLNNLHPTWHFIGHLQRNKARAVGKRIDVLHSLDSIELAKILNSTRDKPLDCFIEISVNGEPNKYGLKMAEVDYFIFEVRRLKNINLVGLMMMAKEGSTYEELLQQFGALVTKRNILEAKFDMKLPYLSMGMSDDYKVALKLGATHLRLGRILYDGYKQ